MWRPISGVSCPFTHESMTHLWTTCLHAVRTAVILCSGISSESCLGKRRHLLFQRDGSNKHTNIMTHHAFAPGKGNPGRQLPSDSSLHQSYAHAHKLLDIPKHRTVLAPKCRSVRLQHTSHLQASSAVMRDVGQISEPDACRFYEGAFHDSGVTPVRSNLHDNKVCRTHELHGDKEWRCRGHVSVVFHVCHIDCRSCNRTTLSSHA